MTPRDDDERIALFLDYENLAIGARESLSISPFDMQPVADALAVRGRVLARRAYADWSFFDEDRRRLTRHHVELIEITQRMGVAGRKNAADIKMAVDALELAFERPYITTFVIGTGDSDFSPLVDKLRQWDRRVIGLGVRDSTSNLLPNSCDEFLFYDDLVPDKDRRNRSERRNRDDRRDTAGSSGSRVASGRGPRRPDSKPSTANATSSSTGNETLGDSVADFSDDGDADSAPDLVVLVVDTLSALVRSGTGPIRASTLKRAILRKDPTFSEADHGFRAFGELLRHLADLNAIEIEGKGDPEVTIAEPGNEDEVFDLLARAVQAQGGNRVPLSSMKDEIRKLDPEFDESDHGYRSFLQFCRGAARHNAIDMTTDLDSGEHLLSSMA